jgi:hypothetical protein
MVNLIASKSGLIKNFYDHNRYQSPRNVTYHGNWTTSKLSLAANLFILRLKLHFHASFSLFYRRRRVLKYLGGVSGEQGGV